ncbi:MAG TPA: dTDP-4-dehydrorhamnose reductase, partial [Usitatibacter sp.]
IRALVTGAGGQVGAQVARILEGRAECVAFDRSRLDLRDPAAIAARIREARPQLIVNAGAYTAVDRAESEEALARAVNAVAPGVIAEEAARCGALLVHFSTDYVFDGEKSSPYVEDDPTHPLSAYGRTKLEGERNIAASGCAHVILRTSWVYGPQGANFLFTMLRLAATRDELRIVDDQRGAPTSSLQLARAVLALFTGPEPARPIGAEDIARVSGQRGLYHATAAGETTWFGFAKAIFEARARGANFKAPRLVAIATREYPTPARRPANSILSNERLERTFGVRLGDWRAGLAETLSALPG